MKCTNCRELLKGKSKKWCSENCRKSFWKKNNPELMQAYSRKSRKLEKGIRREYLRNIKESNPCIDCGISYPYYVMEFDHVRGEKLFNVAVLYKHSFDRLKEEIAKCEVVCANCHRYRTYKNIWSKSRVSV